MSVEGSGFGVSSLGCKVHRVLSLGFWVLGFGFWVLGFGFEVFGPGFTAQGFGGASVFSRIVG